MATFTSAAQVRIKLLEMSPRVLDEMFALATGAESSLLMSESQEKALHVMFKIVAPRISMSDDNFADLELAAIFADSGGMKVPAFQKAQELLDRVLRGELSPKHGAMLLNFVDEIFTQEELDRVNKLLSDPRIADRTKPGLQLVK